MDWREFIASVVGSLAWPAAAVVLIVLLRGQLRTLLEGSVKRLVAGPVEIEYWADAAGRVVESVASLDADLPAGRDHEDSQELAQLAKMADKTPAVVVLGSFRLVERELRAVAQDAGFGDVEPMLKLLAALQVEGVIPPETVNAVGGLLTLRDLAAHDDGSGLSVTPQRAREYVRLTEAVLYALRARHSRGDA